MVLAAYGTNVEERVLEDQARLEPRGTVIDELERLARQFHLVAEIQETTVEDLRRMLAEGRLPPRVTRKSIRLFQLAHRLLGSCCVVCSKPDKVSYDNVIE